MEITVKNALPIPLYFYEIRPNGRQRLVPLAAQGAQDIELKLAPYQTSKPFDAKVGPALVRSAATGGFVGTLDVVAGETEYSVDYEILKPPGEIGLFPKPSKQAILPQDTERIVVGYGVAPNGTVLIREQFWQRTEDSYVLAPRQRVAVSLTVETGIEQVSSQESTIAASLGISGSVGLGAMSASMSASLSMSSTTFQQFTISSKTTRYETTELVNETDHTELFLEWALKDVLTGFAAAAWEPSFALVMQQAPALLDGPYKLGELTAPPPEN